MRRPWNKIALRLVVFILLGAIVNVAVAWGCAAWSPLRYQIDERDIAPDECDWLIRVGCNETIKRPVQSKRAIGGTMYFKSLLMCAAVLAGIQQSGALAQDIACCFGTGCLEMSDDLLCIIAGGEPMGPGTTCLDDVDGDTWPICADCDDSDPDNYKGNAEDCDGKDNNCNGAIDERCEMCAADISPTAGGDCNADGNGTIGPDDLGELLANWGARPVNRCADFAPLGERDGTVGPADLAQMLASWGTCP